jgi:formate dehydrogenase maturation protein FdhE
MPKTRKEYLVRSSRCPVCDSQNIEGSSVEINECGANQYCTCNDCDSEWNDKYILDDYKIISNNFLTEDNL